MDNSTNTTNSANHEPALAEANRQAREPSSDLKNKSGAQANVDSEELDRLKERLAAGHENYLRLAADFENFKKRTARESERRALALKDAFIRDVLPVIDNLERALARDSQSPNIGLQEGVKLTLQQLMTVLQKHALDPELPLGQPFDPHRHEAVGVRRNPAFANGAILEIWQRGWHRRGEVFRHAKVIVNNLESTPLADHAPGT